MFQQALFLGGDVAPMSCYVSGYEWENLMGKVSRILTVLTEAGITFSSLPKQNPSYLLCRHSVNTNWFDVLE